MGVYSDYLNAGLDFNQLETERKKQLKRIAEIRERDVLVYAANVSVRQRAPLASSTPTCCPSMINLRILVAQPST